MALHKVADGQAAAASISLSGVGISTGDLVLIHAYRSGSTTVPSNPGGGTWTDIATSGGANTNSRRIGYRIIQAGDNLATISGTWTNATAIQFIALNGHLASGPIGGSGSGGSNTTTLTTPAVTMSVTNGSSWVVAFAGSKSTNANTVTLSSTTDEGSSQGALNLATGRGVTSYASRNYSATVNASANRMDAVEVLADPLTRTGSDSLATLTESPARVATLPRTGDDALSTLTEAVSRGVTTARTIADSLSTLTESVVKSFSLSRTASDAVSTTYPQVILAESSLVLYYRLNEASGASVLTDSKNGENLTIQVAFDTYRTTGATDDGDYAIANSSRNGYASKGSYGSLPVGASARSFEFWWKWTTQGAAGQYVFSYGGTSNGGDGWSIRMQKGSAPNGEIALDWRTVGDGSSVSNITNLMDGNYHHVVLTYAAGSTQVTLYIDGSSYGTMFFGGAMNTQTTNTPYLASFMDGTTAHMEGTLDEFAVYNTALSSSAVAAHYAARNSSGIGDAVGRVLSIPRAVADTISSITQTVSGSRLLIRSIADSLSSISDSISRAMTWGRTAADTIATTAGGIFDSGIFDSGIFDMGGGVGITESVARVATAARSGADSIASITESVSGVVGAIVRSVSDSLSTLSESVTRTLTVNRAVADSLATLTEAVTRVATMARSAADSIASITEAVVAVVSGTVITRTIDDSLSALSEAVTKALTINRTVADSISAISTAVSRVGTFLRSLPELLPIVHENVGGTLPYNPVAPLVVDLTIDGVSVWADTLYQRAHFESQVNGVAGNCSFRVRDEGRTKSFTDGQEIVLTINAQTVWRGFVATVNRVYVFDALNVGQFGLARFIDITGTDINILLTKRIVFDQSTPENVQAPTLAAHTADVTAIATLFSDWLDLSGDGLDTATYVDNVGDTTWTQAGTPWEGSETWAQAMMSIANLPGAIYYIDPDKHFVYTDVDTPSAPFALSDQPNRTTSFGYSEMEVLKDGTSLANDVLCWGVGYGSQTPVFVRAEDATSQAAHGLWQLGQTTFGVYQQTTINRIASSIIDGSPQNKRGAKDDRVSVQCVTYQPGLRVAQKVAFTSNVFGFSDVIPIRKMEVDFPTPSQPKYSLTLSHEIDTPFSFFDNYWFDFNFPRFVIPHFNLPPIPTPGGCDCGITDSFNRTTSDFGRSDMGALWVDDGTFAPVTVSCDGSYGSMVIGPSGGAYRKLHMAMQSSDYDLSVRFNLSLYANGHSSAIDFVISTLTSFGYNRAACGASFAGEGIFAEYWDGNVFYPFAFTQGVWYTLRMQRIGGAFKVKVWPDGSGEPGWLIEQTQTSNITPMENMNIRGTTGSGVGKDFSVLVDDLNITDVNRCTAVQFEDFNRTVASDWGTATPSGVTWAYPFGLSGITLSVANSVGVAAMSHGSSGPVLRLPVSDQWTKGDGFVITYDFLTGIIPGSSNQVTIDLYDENSQFELFIAVSSDAVYGMVYVLNGAMDASAVKTDWLSNTWYRVKAEYRPGGFVGVKVWPSSGAEPAGWLASTTGDGVALTGWLQFVLTNDAGVGVDYTLRFDFIDFDYAGRPCYPSGPVGGPGLPYNSWVCEDLPATTVLHTSLQYLPNSPQVWINGLLQPQSSYTMDGITIITLGSAPAPTDTIRVCYYALFIAVG